MNTKNNLVLILAFFTFFVLYSTDIKSEGCQTIHQSSFFPVMGYEFVGFDCNGVAQFQLMPTGDVTCEGSGGDCVVVTWHNTCPEQ